MKTIKIKRIGTVLLFAVLATLWLKELTQRNSRAVADRFMGPVLERVEFERQTFFPYLLDIQGKLLGPGWYVSYSSRFCLGEPISIYVDLFGQIRTTNIKRFTNMIPMTEEQRSKEEMKIVMEDRKFFKEISPPSNLK